MARIKCENSEGRYKYWKEVENKKCIIYKKKIIKTFNRRLYRNDESRSQYKESLTGERDCEINVQYYFS